jgi:hypothetical protein
MTQEQLHNVFQMHLHLLRTTLALAIIGGDIKYRFGTMSIESALHDLCQCAINNMDKRAKRIRRIALITEIYEQIGHKFSPDLRETIEMVKLLQVQDEQEKTSDEKITKLRQELSNEAEIQNGKIYFETGEWVPPIVKHFHSMCTKAINKDGDVYDLMMKVAIITFTRLLLNKRMYENDQCATELLSCAQLIFKGGAAIGKFLFKQKPFWNKLTKDQQEEIHLSFIFGGDNDTSIYFINMKQVMKKYGEMTTSKAIIEIASRMQQILWDTCQEFNIDQLLSIHSDNATQDPILFAEHEFGLTTREAIGFQLKEVESYEMDEFEIVNYEDLNEEFEMVNYEDLNEEFEMVNHEDLNEEFKLIKKQTMLCLDPYTDHIPSQVFTTQSKVEFSIRDKVVKFELVRAKLGFRATCNDMIVNTYSELLDISLEYPESAAIFPKKWVAITL